jgi:hypothetical protein
MSDVPPDTFARGPSFPPSCSSTDARLDPPPPSELLRRARALTVAPSERPARDPAGARDCLVVGPGARWFRVNNGPTVRLGRRRPLRRLLLTLARAVGTGAAIPTSGLAVAGWPKETLPASTGSGRVRRTIATLRQLGLRALLVKGPSGYQLDAVVLLETQLDPGNVPLISEVPPSPPSSGVIPV